MSGPKLRVGSDAHPPTHRSTIPETSMVTKSNFESTTLYKNAVYKVKNNASIQFATSIWHDNRANLQTGSLHHSGQLGSTWPLLNSWRRPFENITLANVPNQGRCSQPRLGWIWVGMKYAYINIYVYAVYVNICKYLYMYNIINIYLLWTGELTSQDSWQDSSSNIST